MRNHSDMIRKSKFLSKVMRHEPSIIGVLPDKNGWIDVDLLLDRCNHYGIELDLKTLKYIVESNDKKRFAFSKDQTKIRASQGHSIKVDLELKPLTPPEYLYHGTAKHFLKSIFRDGLLPGKREYVHLTRDIKAASLVGKRHGKLILLRVLAEEMHHEGYFFYRSENNVWLTATVPARFIKQIEQELDGVHLSTNP
ncbi:RNA 2'-phosphotransferase [Hazenella sp. IB182357]|uniref:Probable RNA 2'-phosphotransferase n=1 Tax=Polycladospora coralii TaxID=2771432 RepID=A0A926RVZ6_9BACL|nr:RNA 2'-phosphotransferase [Polycladospora coralii]MBD1370936.1 RNA 2'-phosphotransferase [Polycladospora coralii]MBS7529875.1 RNA 2'-phosphotransferase [Polycladospora coralii]